MCLQMSEGKWARTCYSVVLYAGTPLVLAYLLYRSVRQPEYRRHWGERFGFYRARNGSTQVIWIHAVSVGETRAAQPLVEALLSRWPRYRILLTHMTPTGRAMSEQLFGSRVERVYLAYDYPDATRRFLTHFQPVLGILMETELWPNLLARAARSQVPMVLANARLSEKSFRKAARFSRLAEPGLASLRQILVQTSEDARRLEKLGARGISITGNLKFDVCVPVSQVALAGEFRERIGSRPVLLWASTRAGEEALLLEALGAARLPRGVLVLLVPRHPQRLAEVTELVRGAGLSFQRRSDGAAVAPTTQLWLGDSMGEMFAYYGAAHMAYIGGGLLPYGTQNLIEACAVGCPVIVGPHTFNFAQAVRDAISAGAAVQVASARGVMDTAARLFDDAAARGQMAERAVRFAREHAGATARTIEHLAAILPR